MSFKTICIITITVLVTVFLTLNTDPVSFNLIFTTKTVSKLLVVGVCFVAGFLVGLLVGRPRKQKSKETADLSNTIHNPTQKTLSSEDESYLEMD